MIKPPCDDPIPSPSRQPRGVTIVLPPLLSEDAPWPVNGQITTDSQKNFTAIDLRCLDDKGNMRRAIDIREGETVNAAAFKKLVKAAVVHNGREKKR